MQKKVLSEQFVITHKVAAILKFDRQKLISFQRKFANYPPNGVGSVIDGRDITSVITPNAEVKFYIDADVKIRAERRLSQLDLPESCYHEILKDLIKRDFQDKRRKISPLIKTADSQFINTSKINESEVLNKAIEHIKKKLILFSDCI